MSNHSSQPNKYPSINHEMMDNLIKSGDFNPSTNMSTVSLNEVPSYKEWLSGKYRMNNLATYGLTAGTVSHYEEKK